MLQSAYKKLNTPEEQTFWQSYSDMMAALLLIFILIIAFYVSSLTKATEIYNIKITELNTKNADLYDYKNRLKHQEIALQHQKKAYEKQASLIEQKNRELAKQKEAYQAQELKLIQQQKALNIQELELIKLKEAFKQQENILSQQQKAFIEQETELIKQKEAFKQQENILSQQQKAFIEQETELIKQKEIFKQQEIQLTLQQKAFEEQESLLKENMLKFTKQQNLLISQKDILTRQQLQLDQLIGIRSELIQKLKIAFDKSSMGISVDSETGAISFDSKILFDLNSFNLKNNGIKFLNNFFPQYFAIILDEQLKPYVAEIIIEGHTDNTGTYLYNLDLSQKRAFSVAAYCLNDESKIFNSKTLNQIRKLVTANGRAFYNLKYNTDGTVNLEASRRVEIKFRLKEEEMIKKMTSILGGK